MNTKKPFRRKPVALANWKMAMIVSEGFVFVKEFSAAIGDLAKSIDIVICPPFTSIFPLSRELTDSPIELGAQNLCAGSGETHTGEISAPLLAEAGCKWVMLGHWEVRHREGETDADVNMKMHAAFETGLWPILLIGERIEDRGRAQGVLATRLPILFGGCDSGDAAQVTILYEPEWAVGAHEPAPPHYIAVCCGFIRNWIQQKYGQDVAKTIRIIYGGSVAPEHAKGLLNSQDVDGLGAGRKGRDPLAFANIVRQIASAKGLL